MEDTFIIILYKMDLANSYQFKYSIVLLGSIATRIYATSYSMTDTTFKLIDLHNMDLISRNYSMYSIVLLLNCLLNTCNNSLVY